MKKHLAGLAALAFIFNGIPALAETGIVELTAGAWQHDPSGSVQYQGTQVDVDQDLQLGSETEGFVRLNVSHGVPLIPNFQIAHTRLTHGGAGTVTSSFTFGGTTFNVSEDIVTDLEMNQTDLVLFYSPLDNVVELDLGLDLRRVDGKVQVTSVTNSTTESQSFDEIIPLLYARVGFDVPLSNLSLGATAAAISYNGDRITDLSGYVRYTWKVIGIEGGYRAQNLNADDLAGVTADVDLKGPYLAVVAVF